jgi:hypothetical protein
MTELTVKLRSLFDSRILYLCWGVGSGAALLVTSFIDPYVFGLAAFVAAALTGFLAVGALALAWRQWPWVVACAIPTVLSFCLLSTYKWA